jgi:hypothetical protein
MLRFFLFSSFCLVAYAACSCKHFICWGHLWRVFSQVKVVYPFTETPGGDYTEITRRYFQFELLAHILPESS